jgi:hypothetical protein
MFFRTNISRKIFLMMHKMLYGLLLFQNNFFQLKCTLLFFNCVTKSIPLISLWSTQFFFENKKIIYLSSTSLYVNFNLHNAFSCRDKIMNISHYRIIEKFIYRSIGRHVHEIFPFFSRLIIFVTSTLSYLISRVDHWSIVD